MSSFAVAGALLALGSFVMLCVMPVLLVVKQGLRRSRAQRLEPLALALSAGDAELLSSRRFEAAEILSAFGFDGPPRLIDGGGVAPLQPGPEWYRRIAGDLRAPLSSVSIREGDAGAAEFPVFGGAPDVNTVAGIDGAVERCTHEAVPDVSEDDLLAAIVACLTDVVDRGRVISGRLVAQGEPAGADLLQDVARSVDLLLLQLADQRAQVLDFLAERQRRRLSSHEALEHVEQGGAQLGVIARIHCGSRKRECGTDPRQG